MSKCAVENCGREDVVMVTGYCGTKGMPVGHHQRFRKYGDPLAEPSDGNAVRWADHVKVDKICAASNCDKRSYRANYCAMHGKRLRLYGELEPGDRRGEANKRRSTTPEDFWKHIKISAPDVCWEFDGAVNEWGYGRISYQGKIWSTHRLAFYLTHDKLPEPMCLHHCDNPPCCNPDHLYAGDDSQNMRDMYDRDRANRPTGSDWWKNRQSEFPFRRLQ